MSQSPIVDEPGAGRLHIWPLPTDEATLLALVTDVFSHYWEHIHFGVIVQRAAWEVAALRRRTCPTPPTEFVGGEAGSIRTSRLTNLPPIFVGVEL